MHLNEIDGYNYNPFFLSEQANFVKKKKKISSDL